MATSISGSREPKEFPDLVLLEPIGRTHCYDDTDAAASAVKNDPTAVSVDTSNNRSGHLSFTLSPLPSISYLDLHWPYGMPKVPSRVPALPQVVSVDENLLLIRIDQLPCGTDWFVCSACASSSSSLRRLPECTMQIQDLAGRSRFLQLDTDIGILRRSGDENDYVVADLAVSWKARGGPGSLAGYGYDYNDPPPMKARLCAFSSKTGEWTAKEMVAPQPGNQEQFPVLWCCDTVVPFAGHYLCWVDYYSGLLFGDFSDEGSPRLSYVPFPTSCKYSDEVRVERNFPESFRRVAVSNGNMRFIHIGDDNWQDAGYSWHTSLPVIKVWNLKMRDNGIRWDLDRVIDVRNLWAHPTYQSHSLPNRPPEFPLVIKNDPDVLCCVLREGEYYGKAWIIMLDIKQLQFPALMSCIPYTIEAIEGGDTLRQYDIVSMHVGPPLIPSDFSKYLNNPSGLQWNSNKMADYPSKRSKVEL